MAGLHSRKCFVQNPDGALPASRTLPVQYFLHIVCTAEVAEVLMDTPVEDGYVRMHYRTGRNLCAFQVSVQVVVGLCHDTVSESRLNKRGDMTVYERKQACVSR